MKVKMIRTFEDKAQISDIMLYLEKRIKTLEMVLQMSLSVLGLLFVRLVLFQKRKSPFGSFFFSRKNKGRK